MKVIFSGSLNNRFEDPIDFDTYRITGGFQDVGAKSRGFGSKGVGTYRDKSLSVRLAICLSLYPGHSVLVTIGHVRLLL